MDKLEPIIRHRFWILLGLVVPLTAFGYFKASGSMKAATDDRIKQIDGLNVPTGTEPNPRWAEGMSRINGVYEESVNAELLRVWERQQARMTWPTGMQKYLPANYRDPFENRAGFVYAAEYPELVREVYNSIDPVVVNAQGRITGGKVIFQQSQIPQVSFTSRLSIPSEMIWDTQEDLWYLRLLFDAIRRVNQPSENAAKSAVRAVLKVELWGGNGESSVRGASTGGSGESGMGSVMSENMMQYGAGGSMGMGEGMELLGGGAVGQRGLQP